MRLEDCSERYWEIKNSIKNELPYCWQKETCVYRVLHRCKLLKKTDRDACKFYRSR